MKIEQIICPGCHKRIEVNVRNHETVRRVRLGNGDSMFQIGYGHGTGCEGGIVCSNCNNRVTYQGHRT